MTTTLLNKDQKTSARQTPGGKPAEELDFDGFVSIACGHTAFQLLWAGTQFDLFTILEERGALTRGQIAHQLDLEAQPLRILLHGLTALKLLKKTGARYENSAVARRFLNKHDPENWLPILGWQHHIVYKGLFDFVDSLKKNKNVGLRHFPGKGNNLYQRLRSDSPTERVFQDAMSSLSKKSNRELAEYLDLSEARHLLDIGGGDGTNAMNLVRANPGLKATVFDSNTVLANARRNIAESGFSESVDTCEGECFSDPFPEGVDTILLAHMMTIWSPEKNTELIRKCRAALPKGGRLLIFNMVSYDDETGPLINAMGSPYFQAIATGEGMLYCSKDVRSWLKKAGFTKVNSKELPFEHAVFEATK